MTHDQSVRNALAAESLEQRIKRAIKETEREFGVYIHSETTNRVGYIDDMHSVSLIAAIWPASMRIIETERDSKAIG